jgi:hypothetical protein
MSHLIKSSLLVLILLMTLCPVIGNAASMGGGEAPNASSGVSDTLIGSNPASQQQELKYTDMAPQGGQPAVSAENEGQEKTTSPPAKKEKIQVVYDKDTEKDRGILITLIIAFGISLALNIYLATSLIAARRGM